MTLRDRLSKLSRKAAGEADTPERSQARRVLRSITAGASGRVQDREYLTLLEQYPARSGVARGLQTPASAGLESPALQSTLKADS